MFTPIYPNRIPSQTNEKKLQSLYNYCYLDFGNLILDNFSLTASLTNSDRDLYPNPPSTIIQSILFTKSDGNLIPGYSSLFAMLHQYHMFVFKLKRCKYVTPITQSLYNGCYI